MSRAAGQTDLQPSRLSEEEQIELAAAAARAERAARPRHLLVLAGLLLVAALIAMIVSSTRLTAARSSLKFQMQLADSMSEEVASLELLHGQRHDVGKGADRFGRRAKRLLEEIAVAAVGRKHDLVIW